MHILLAHASVHGSTAEMADFMAGVLREHGYETTTTHVEALTTWDNYGAILPGAPVHGGVWVRPMLSFIRRHHAHLAQIPVFPWMTCIRVLEEDGYEHARQHYLPNDILELPRVLDTGIFAGRLDINSINYEERWMLSLRYDGGEALQRLKGDFRDWKVIRAWAEKVARRLQLEQR